MMHNHITSKVKNLRNREILSLLSNIIKKLPTWEMLKPNTVLDYATTKEKGWKKILNRLCCGTANPPTREMLKPKTILDIATKMGMV